MAAETEALKFKIDDQEYEVPLIDELDMDEWQIVYDYSGLLLDDFARLEDEDAELARLRKVAQPAFTRSMLHIGYRRVHPDAKPDAIRKLTGEANLVRVLEALGAAQGEKVEEVPLASTTEPGPSSQRDLVDSNDTESKDSLTSLDEPAGQPEPIGTSG